MKGLLTESFGEVTVAASALPWVAALVATAERLPARAWVSGMSLCVAGAELTLTQARVKAHSRRISICVCAATPRHCDATATETVKFAAVA